MSVSSNVLLSPVYGTNDCAAKLFSGDNRVASNNITGASNAVFVIIINKLPRLEFSSYHKQGSSFIYVQRCRQYGLLRYQSPFWLCQSSTAEKVVSGLFHRCLGIKGCIQKKGNSIRSVTITLPRVLKNYHLYKPDAGVWSYWSTIAAAWAEVMNMVLISEPSKARKVAMISLFILCCFSSSLSFLII